MIVETKQEQEKFAKGRELSLKIKLWEILIIIIIIIITTTQSLILSFYHVRDDFEFSHDFYFQF